MLELLEQSAANGVAELFRTTRIYCLSLSGGQKLGNQGVGRAILPLTHLWTDPFQASLAASVIPWLVGSVTPVFTWRVCVSVPNFLLY